MSEDRQVTGKLDIWDALSKVYNMPDVPDEAKSIIGDVMLCLQSEEPEPEQNTTSEQPVSDRLGVKTGKTCTDTISRQAAIDAFMAEHPDGKDSMRISWALNVLDELPSVQPERKTGQWTEYPLRSLRYECSGCRSKYLVPWHYCPNCGADMRGGNDETN